eukprot:2872419-Prymnesium_polylepis.1
MASIAVSLSVAHESERHTVLYLALAPSSRSRCLKCRKPIGKGQPCLVLILAVTPRRTARKSRCLDCVDGKLANAVVVACGSAANLPVAHNADPGAAASLKRLLVTLSGQPASGDRDERGKCEVQGDGARWRG